MIATPMERYNRVGLRTYMCINKMLHNVSIDSFTETSIDESIHQEFNMRIHVTDGVLEKFYSKGRATRRRSAQHIYFLNRQRTDIKTSRIPVVSPSLPLHIRDPKNEASRPYSPTAGPKHG